MSDYISREASLRYLNDIWLTATPDGRTAEEDKPIAVARCMGLNDAMDAIKSIPAADVREVVRGKWLFDCERQMHDGWTYRQYHCTVCGFQMVGGIHNFCPNCGADMKEKTVLKCTDCLHLDVHQNVCSVCFGMDKFTRCINTNADKIRAMSDEELADWVWGAETAGRAYGPRGKNAWLDWLQREAET
ncbi:MAG: hypothetical protein J6W82_05185 [Bacteroidales bacterium]|nr:hypothetical protein [Bacteroidales bacterium]